MLDVKTTELLTLLREERADGLKRAAELEAAAVTHREDAEKCHDEIVRILRDHNAPVALYKTWLA